MKSKKYFVICLLSVGLILTSFLSKSTVYAQSDTPSESQVCNGIKLNTDVPFIWDCITIYDPGEVGENTDGTVVTPVSAFPRLMWGLTKIMMWLILAVSFLLVIVAGVLMVIGGAQQEYYNKGTKLLKIVVTAIAVLGTSGIILRLINPNFFGI